MDDVQPTFDISHPVDHDEGDVCRVCRVEGDEADPLIHPCKCSGSVRFVHPDCLRHWLAASQKRHCEICGYNYAFTKVYQSIPPVIPKVVYIRQALNFLVKVARFIARACLVITAWLILLPSSNMITLRSLIWLADSISHSRKGSSATTSDALNTTLANATETINATIANGSMSNDSLTIEEGLGMRDFILRPFSSLITVGVSALKSWYKGEENTLPGFVFRGQILTISIAAVVAALVITREFLIQHRWNERLAPEPEEEEVINPDEWVVQGGVAHKVADLMKDAMRTARLNALHERIEQEKRKEQKRKLRRRKLQPRIDAQGNEWEVKDLPWRRGQTLAEPSTAKENASEGENGENNDDTNPDSPPITRRRSWPNTMLIPARFEPHSVADLEPGDLPLDVRVPEDETATSAPMSPSSSGSATRPARLERQKPNMAYTAPELLGTGAEKEEEESVITFGTPKPEEAPTETEEPVASGSGTSNAESFTYRIASKFHEDLSPPGIEESALLDAISLLEGEDTSKTWEEVFGEHPGVYSDMKERAAAKDANTGLFLTPETLEPVPPHEAGGAERTNDGAQIVVIADGQDAAILIPPAPARAGAERRPHQEVPERANGEWVMEEEMEGAEWEREQWRDVLELAGLIGPLGTLFQNLALVVVVLGGAITILIGTPMIIGKVFLASNFVRMSLTITTEIIALARCLTDPVVDICIEIARDVLLYPSLASYQAFEGIISRKLGIDSISSKILPLPSSQAPNLFTRLFGESQGDSKIGDAFAAIGNWAVKVYTAQRTLSAQIATSQKLGDRVWCTAVGYGIVFAGLSIVAITGDAHFRRKSAEAQEQWKQHASFAKLAFFLLVDTGLLPTVAGLMVNLSLVPLFENASLLGRLKDFRTAPFTAVVINWGLGAGFSIAFGNVLILLRSSIRPGAMFFLRDPQDPTFSPIKEHMERPTLLQLRRLSWSLFIHAFLIFTVLGLPMYAARYQPFIPLLPLKYTNLSPLTSVPFDILFLHLVVPATYDALRPTHRLKKLFTRFWSLSARLLCLSSLIYGQKDGFRPKSGPHFLEAIWPVLNPLHNIAFSKYDITASWARVPANDRVPLRPESERRKEGVFVRLDDNGAPLSDEGKMLILKQNKSARIKKHDPVSDYEVVWLPPYWKVRAWTFAFWTLALCATLICGGLFGPLLVGRAAWRMAVDQPIHDGYHYIAGAYIILLAAYGGRSVGIRVTRSALASRLRRSTKSTRGKRAVTSFLRNVYALFLLYLVLPMFLGVAFDLYLSIPYRYGFDGKVAPVLHIWDAWANGVMLQSMFLVLVQDKFSRAHNPRRTKLMAELDRMRTYVRSPLQTSFYTLNWVVLPFLGHTLVITLLPTILVSCIFLALPSFGLESPKIDPAAAVSYRMIYPVALFAQIMVGARPLLYRKWMVIRQRMIDAEYVVEEKVENYEPGSEEKKSDDAKPTEEEEKARRRQHVMEYLERVQNNGPDGVENGGNVVRVNGVDGEIVVDVDVDVDGSSPETQSAYEVLEIEGGDEGEAGDEGDWEDEDEQAMGSE